MVRVLALVSVVVFSHGDCSTALPDWTLFPSFIFSIFDLIYLLNFHIHARNKINKMICDISLLLVISNHIEVNISKYLGLSGLYKGRHECKNVLIKS